jgi:hypothetical protein
MKDFIDVLKKQNTINEERLTTLIDLIFNNTGLSYTKNELRIKDDTAILQYIKVICPDRYDEELFELQNNVVKTKEGKHIPAID